MDNENRTFTEQKPQSTRGFHIWECYKTTLLSFSKMTTERSWVEWLESWWCQLYTLLCISLPFWCICRRTQQKTSTLSCHLFKERSEPTNTQPFSYGFLKMGGAGKGPDIGSSSPRVHLTPWIAKSFSSYLQWKSPGDKVGKCIFCALVYCFFYRSLLFAIVLWSPYKLIQGNEGNTKTRFFALYFLPMNIYCLRQVNQYIKYQYLFNEIIETANKLHGCF